MTNCLAGGKALTIYDVFAGKFDEIGATPSRQSQYQKAALAKCHPQDPQDPQTKNPQKRPIYQYNQFVTPKSGVIHWAAAQRHLNSLIREQRANAIALLVNPNNPNVAARLG
jgi:hypothetical protein